MPLTAKGETIKANMEEQYGKEKGEHVFYAAKNKGTITGVDHAEADMGPGHIARHVGKDALYHNAVGKGPAPDPGESTLDQPPKPRADEGNGEAPLRQLEKKLDDEKHGQLLMKHCDELETRWKGMEPKLNDCMTAATKRRDEETAKLAGEAATAAARAERAGAKTQMRDAAISSATHMTR